MTLIKSYAPAFDHPGWRAARAALAASDIRVAQIDTGLFPHPAVGFAGDTPPANIILTEGRNLFDPDTSPFGRLPLTDLSTSGGTLSDLTEVPDHGIKTLGIILSDTTDFRGAAPGAKVIPYRASNGPVFRRSMADLDGNLNATARIGACIEHALALANPPRVFTISMGNPGFLPWEFIRLWLGGSIGIAKSTAKAIDRAYLRGIPVVCAAGQVERSVLFPAVMKRTIAVGGYERRDDGGLTHYPHGGYNNQSRVDCSALAVGLNRPGGKRLPDGSIQTNHAAGEVPPVKPEGTSFATPFVAAGYAMWFETHRAVLTGPAYSGTNAWRRVEAFRRILREGMPIVMADAGHQGAPDIAVRPLDIPRLLRTPPDIAGLEMAPPFKNLWFSNTDTAEDYGLMV
jgi:hypothetical protein